MPWPDRGGFLMLLHGTLPHTIPQPPTKSLPPLHTRLFAHGAHSGWGATRAAVLGPGAADWVQVARHALPRAGDASIRLRRVENVGVASGWAWFGLKLLSLVGACSLAGQICLTPKKMHRAAHLKHTNTPRPTPTTHTPPIYHYLGGSPAQTIFKCVGGPPEPTLSQT